MNEKSWEFVDGAGTWFAESFGGPAMTGRVMGWLLVCDPPEQTAAQLAEALGASKGAISGATSMLVKVGLIERLHVRGERADRFRLRAGAWDDQVRNNDEYARARAVLAVGLDALADAPAARRARLEELDAFYAWYETRMDQLWQEWQDYKRDNLEGGDGNG